MRANIHPQYFETQVSCSCGNSFTVGSTVERIHTELCYKCHPFYTGQQKFVDTASRIEKFQKKMDAYKPVDKKTKEIKEDKGPMTLRDMLQALKSK